MVWQYLLTKPLDGKPPGWHPYTPDASAKIDALQHQATSTNSHRTTYHIKSGYYTYEVNLLAMTQRNQSTGTVRQIRQSAHIDCTPCKKQKTSPLALESLFGTGSAHHWEDILTPVLQAELDADKYIGLTRTPTMVPVRELTFQALLPNAPVNWRVIVLGQNPYPRLESATGVAMFDATLDDWNSPKFGITTSMRCLIKAAAVAEYKVGKDTPVTELRELLAKKEIVSPAQWFQALLTQGVLLLNAALTTGGGETNAAHAKFWLPVLRVIVNQILEEKAQLEDGDSRKGILFLWWGSQALKMKSKLKKILAQYEQDLTIRHLEWCNPAAQGDKFCEDPPHFVQVNKELGQMGMDTIDWLPDKAWLAGPGASSSAMGQFISDTKKLHSMYLERLQSGLDIGEDIKPIIGVRDGPEKNMVDACAPLGLASQARYAVSVVKQVCADELSEDEKGAIYLYTGNCLYARLNKSLRATDRARIECYFGYLKLFLQAHDKLCGANDWKVLYRGINKNVSKGYKLDAVITWWSVSSCSKSWEVATGFGGGTMFHVKAKTAVPIRHLSAYPGEEEYILAPGTRLTVTDIVHKGSMAEVFLEEVVGERLVS